jgi:hypothetical protein
MWNEVLWFAALAIMLGMGSLLAISPRTYRDFFARSHLQQRYFDKGSPKDYRILGTLFTAFALWMTVLLVRDYMTN